MSDERNDARRARSTPGGSESTTTRTTTTTTPTTVRAGLALIATCTSAAALYAILRIAQKLFFPEPDPALVLWSEHAGYYWRVWTALYAGGTTGFVAWVTSGRHAARTARVLATALVVSTLLLIAQSALVP